MSKEKCHIADGRCGSGAWTRWQGHWCKSGKHGLTEDVQSHGEGAERELTEKSDRRTCDPAPGTPVFWRIGRGVFGEGARVVVETVRIDGVRPVCVWRLCREKHRTPLNIGV